LRRLKGLLLLAVLLAGLALPAAEEKKAEPDRWRRALERSLLFPGLGQLGEKQYAKAALFAASEIACLALVVVQIGKGNDVYWNYRNAASADDAVRWRRETERCDRRRNIAILGAAGVWVLNMVDMFTFAKKKYGRERSLALHPFYHHETQAFGAGVTCRF
jgi:hypothetical protein